MNESFICRKLVFYLTYNLNKIRGHQNIEDIYIHILISRRNLFSTHPLRNDCCVVGFPCFSYRTEHNSALISIKVKRLQSALLIVNVEKALLCGTLSHLGLKKALSE